MKTLNGSFTIDDKTFTLKATEIEPLDEGHWFEIEVNFGNGPLRTRAGFDTGFDFDNDPVGFVLEVFSVLKERSLVPASS